MKIIIFFYANILFLYIYLGETYIGTNARDNKN